MPDSVHIETAPDGLSTNNSDDTKCVHLYSILYMNILLFSM